VIVLLRGSKIKWALLTDTQKLYSSLCSNVDGSNFYTRHRYHNCTGWPNKEESHFWIIITSWWRPVSKAKYLHQIWV